MKSLKNIILTLLFSIFCLQASAVTVNDTQGKFTIDYQPKRIVALEYSFVDSLANLGISPVGVADDKDPTRILESVRNKIQAWTSVGTRSQPSLEAIAALKPDLIIADQNRHSAVYEQLKQIAPTILLKSRKETYQENLETAQIIGDVVGKSEEMKQLLADHKKMMEEIAARIPKNQHVVIALSRPNDFFITTENSYTGGLAKALGLVVDKAINEGDANNKVGLEQLLVSNPDYLFIVHYNDESIAKKWAEEALWKALPVVKNGRVFNTNDPALWTRSRGLDASEQIAEIIADHINKHK